MKLLRCSATLTLATMGCGLGDSAAERNAPMTPPTGEERARDDAGDLSPMPEVPTPAAEEPAPVDETAARVELVRKMIDEGMDVNKSDADGRTALMVAAFDGYTGVVELLLDHGADVDHLDGAGRTALMYASSGPFTPTVELLLARRANVNQIDGDEGWSALMLAAAEGNLSVVEVLLRNGADQKAVDKDGDKAVDHARERGQSDVVALLESKS